MEKALERTIETLIDSGGDKWEYDSNDIQILVQWIESKQKEVNVALGNVSNSFTEQQTDNAYDKGFNDGAIAENEMH
jgi:hypothetical protein